MFVAVLDATNKERLVENDPVSACLDSVEVDLPRETVQDDIVCADLCCNRQRIKQ